LSHIRGLLNYKTGFGFDDWIHWTFIQLVITLFDWTLLTSYHTTLIHSSWSRAELSRAVAYCRQPASMVTPSIEPHWDPWPYNCSMSRLLFFFSSFIVPPLIKREGLDFSIFLKRCVLIKNRTMVNVQKHNNCIFLF
jgi:hypothetical protein